MAMAQLFPNETNLIFEEHLITEFLTNLTVLIFVILFYLFVKRLNKRYERIRNIKRKHKTGRKLKVKHMSDSELHALEASTSSASELTRVPSDLHKFNRRISANVEKQRKHIEILQECQDKVAKWRQEAAAAAAATKDEPLHKSSPSLFQPGIPRDDFLPDRSFFQDSSSTPGLLQVVIPPGRTDVDLPESSLTRSRSVPHYTPKIRSTTRDVTTTHELMPAHSIHSVLERLNEEQYKNETFRDSMNILQSTNTTLNHELQRLRELYRELEEASYLKMANAQRTEQKNRRKVEMFNRRIYDMWLEMASLKRKIRELKSVTEDNLDSHRMELVQFAAKMENLIAQRQFLKSIRLDQTNREYQETIDELKKRYDEIVSLNSHLETERNEKHSKILLLETSIKQTGDERSRLEEYLKKIQLLPELTEALGRRTRSLSPGTSMPYDTLRNVKTALSLQAHELETMKKELEKIKSDNSDLETRLSQARLAEREKEKALHQERITTQELKYEREQLENQVKKLEEKSQRGETEKIVLKARIDKLGEQLIEIQNSHKAALDDLRSKQQEEMETRWSQLLSEQEQRERNADERVHKAQAECQKLREELATQKEHLLEAQRELALEKRKSSEKDIVISESQRREKRLSEENHSLNKQLQDNEIKIVELDKRLDEVNERHDSLNEAHEELKLEKATLNKENSQLTDEVNLLRAEIMQNMTKNEAQHQAQQDLTLEIETLKETIQENEKAIEQHRTSIKDLEINLETNINKLHIIQKELDESKREIQNRLESESNLNKEKTTLIICGRIESENHWN
uniref:Rootletin-like coiled-coil domain-containing protein n=1 Tax=Acrobeloides nanus TaxID=290746 RepID=A0A914C5B0_9BILA